MAGSQTVMEPSSAMRKRKVGWCSWQLVFLAASILSSCFLLTEVRGSPIQFPIDLYPITPIAGINLSLNPKEMWPDLVSCQWFRVDTTPERLILSYNFQTNRISNGPAFTRRHSANSSCSLFIRPLRSEDSGTYLMIVNTTNQYAEGYIPLAVIDKLTSPLLKSSPPNGLVEENSIDVLTCHTSNHPDVEVSWFKDGQPLPPAMGDLSNQNRTLTLSHVARSNTGTYSCRAKNIISHPESNPVQILVTHGPEVKLNPEGTIYKHLNSDLVVECLADSVPEAKFQWFFNGIKQKETGSIFQARLTEWVDSGSYTCKATNPFTNHSDERTGYVVLRKDKRLSVSAIAGIAVGCVAGVALIAGLLYFISTKASFRRNGPPATTGRVPSNHARKAVPRKSSPSLSRASRGSRSPSSFSV